MTRTLLCLAILLAYGLAGRWDFEDAEIVEARVVELPSVEVEAQYVRALFAEGAVR